MGAGPGRQAIEPRQRFTPCQASSARHTGVGVRRQEFQRGPPPQGGRGITPATVKSSAPIPESLKRLARGCGRASRFQARTLSTARGPSRSAMASMTPAENERADPDEQRRARQAVGAACGEVQQRRARWRPCPGRLPPEAELPPGVARRGEQPFEQERRGDEQEDGGQRGSTASARERLARPEPMAALAPGSIAGGTRAPRRGATGTASTPDARPARPRRGRGRSGARPSRFSPGQTNWSPLLCFDERASSFRSTPLRPSTRSRPDDTSPVR